MIWVLRSFYHFLRFLSAKFFHCSVVMLLAFGEKHFQDSSLVLQNIHLMQPSTLGMKFTFFFRALKLSMMTPMKRLRVKKEPKIMKKTK